MRISILFLCIVVVSLLIFMPLAYSESDLPYAILVSYDYSSDINFGTGYRTAFDIQRDGDVSDEDPWIRLWLRIHVFTPKNSEWTHPQQYQQAMSMTNVNVSSANDDIIVCTAVLLSSVNAMPPDCTPSTITAWYDDWDEYWDRMFPDWSLASLYASESFWSQSFEDGETEWILELLVADKGQNEENMARLVHSLTIQCEMDASFCGFHAKSMDVNVKNAQREVRFDKSAMEIRADSFYEEEFTSSIERTEYLCDPNTRLLCASDNDLTEYLSDPKRYTLIEISLTALKQMPWAVCNVEAAIKPNDTVIGIVVNQEDQIDDSDRWKNGFYFLHPLQLLVKKSDMSAQQLLEKLKELDLSLAFSTEFAGTNDFSTKRNGYPGVRFTLHVDMAEMVTYDEIMTRLGDVSDG